MRTYEFTVIFKPNDDETAQGKEVVKNEFEANGVQIVKEDDLGIKFLAYPIKKTDKGHYMYFELEAEPETITVLDRAFKLSTPVLKFLFVKKEK
jgi:small subunit ribosomal protein S6